MGGAIEISPETWSASISMTLTPIVAWGGPIGIADYEVSQRMCEVSMTLPPVPEVAGDHLARRHRPLLLSWGPSPGCALLLPAAYLTASEKGRELGGDGVRQTLAYREGRPLTETPLEEEGADHLAGSPIRLAFALTPEA
ncbi:MAG: hypothetical protein R3F65_30070 [bacterium]